MKTKEDEKKTKDEDERQETMNIATRTMTRHDLHERIDDKANLEYHMLVLGCEYSSKQMYLISRD